MQSVPLQATSPNKTSPSEPINTSLLELMDKIEQIELQLQMTKHQNKSLYNDLEKARNVNDQMHSVIQRELLKYAV